MSRAASSVERGGAPESMTIGTLILGSALLVTSAVLLASCVRLRSAIGFCLAVYLAGFGTLVVCELALSPSRLLTRGWLLAVLAGATAVSVVAWQLCSRPRPPSFRPAAAALREAFRDPLLVVLGLAVAAGFGYVVAISVGTAPNDADVLWYHLARAAFWKQQHAVSFIAGANDSRLNVFAPNAEIADSFTMILGGTARFTGFVQLAALWATMIAVTGIARRIGLSPRQAIYAALLLATLPVVVLQASDPVNDLVVASFLACCAYFLFEAGATIALSALALGLALGTKVTAVLALPVLALLAAFCQPRRRWLLAIGVGMAGIALGFYWYALNLVETHHLSGKLTQPTQSSLESGNTFSGTGFAAHILRLSIDAVDPSGAVGRDRFVYLVAGCAVLAVGALLAYRARSRRALAVAIVAATLAALPLFFRQLQHGLLHAYQKLWLELDSRHLAFLGFDKHPARASPFQSWYGPLGIALFLVGLVLVYRARRQGAVTRAAAILALAPLVWIVLQSAITFYTFFDGRYMIFAVALATAVWGLVLPIRPLAWAATAIAVTTLALALVHYDEKPSGVNVLGGAAPTSVWDLSRVQVLSHWFPPGAASVVQTIEDRAAKGSTIAVRLRPQDVTFPYFGDRLDRRVLFVPANGKGLDGADWLVLAPGQTTVLPPGWQRVATGGYGWRVYSRSPSAAS
jgi:4-amino-4-deoxy-L-arabinose transferase-like glycosyltransferase